MSSFTIRGVMEVTELDYLSRFPAAYVVEHQTSRRHIFKRKYRTIPVGPLTRVFVRRPALLPARRPDPTGARARSASQSMVTFDGRLGLVGTSVGRGVAYPGGILTLTHHWTKASPRLWGRYEVLSALEDEHGTWVWREKNDLAYGLLAPEEWQHGAIYDEKHVVFVPDDAPPGPYRVVVRVREKGTRRILPIEGARQVAVAHVEILPRPGEPAVEIARR